MKKAIVIAIIAFASIGAAFASDGCDVWLGPTSTLYFQGVGATFDFGDFDLTASFSIPLSGYVQFYYQAYGEQWNWGEFGLGFLYAFKYDELKIGGYWSALEADFFTLNVGLQADVVNGFKTNNHDEVGGYLVAMLSPSIELKFTIDDDVLIKVQANYPTFYGLDFSDDGVEQGSIGIDSIPPAGLYASYRYGKLDLSLIPMLAAAASLNGYVSVSVQFEL